MRQCLNQEEILAWVSVPDELSAFKKLGFQAHAWRCAHCRDQVAQMKKTWSAYFNPEPDITSSLLKVYSNLKHDQTLVLKGWKLGEARPAKTWNTVLLKEAWLFRGGVSLALGSILGILIYSQITDSDSPRALARRDTTPVAQIRLQEKNGVKVHYIQPELLQTIEFETTRSSP